MPNQRDKSIGAMFHSQTKYRRGVLPGAIGKAVPTIKVYANPLEVAALPVPDINGGKGVWEALALGRAVVIWRRGLPDSVLWWRRPVWG